MLHRCFLLPVSDNIQGTIGEELFNRTEKMLNENKWCDYHQDPKLQTLLYKYRRNLDEALTAQEVLRLVAQKTQVGSVIRLKAEYQQQKMHLMIDIMDADGREFLYRKNEELADDSIDRMMEIIGESLQEYAHDLPYRAVVVEMVGNDLILKTIGTEPFQLGNIIRIENPIRPIKHPLLKKVVEWETDKIGEAEVLSLRPPFFRAKLIPQKNMKAAIGQWASLVRPGVPPKNPNAPAEYVRTQTKVYELSATANLLSPLASNNYQGNKEEVKGTIFAGVEGRGYLRITPDFWSELVLNYHLGLTGGFSSSSQDGVQVKLGYRFTPIAHRPLIHISPYIAYDYQSFDYNSSGSTNFVSTQFTNYLFGLIGNYPIGDRYTLIGEMNFALSSDVTASDNKYQGDKKSTVGKVEIGLRYDYQAPYDLLFKIGHQKYTANIGDDELSYGDLRLSFGLIYKY